MQVDMTHVGATGAILISVCSCVHMCLRVCRCCRLLLCAMLTLSQALPRHGTHIRASR